jgi:hypothetical protein
MPHSLGLIGSFIAMCLDHACTRLFLVYQTKTWPEHRALSNHKKKKKKDLPLLHKEKRIYIISTRKTYKQI